MPVYPKIYTGHASTTGTAWPVKWLVEAGSSSSTVTTAWQAWNCATAASTSYTDILAWEVWARDNAQSRTAMRNAYGVVRNAQPIVNLPPITAEMRERFAREDQARAEREARREAERKAVEEIRKAASDKALALLLSAITPEQRASLLTNGYFFVRSQRGNLYRIDNGSHRNVRRCDPVTKKVVETFCIYATDDCPAGDNMLAQKLLLETMEDHFLAKANRWDHTPPVIGVVPTGDILRVAQVAPAAN